MGWAVAVVGMKAGQEDGCGARRLGRGCEASARDLFGLARDPSCHDLGESDSIRYQGADRS